MNLFKKLLEKKNETEIMQVSSPITPCYSYQPNTDCSLINQLKELQSEKHLLPDFVYPPHLNEFFHSHLMKNTKLKGNSIVLDICYENINTIDNKICDFIKFCPIRMGISKEKSVDILIEFLQDYKKFIKEKEDIHRKHDNLNQQIEEIKQKLGIE